MSIENLNQREQAVLNLLMQIPPDISAAENYLESAKLTKRELSVVANYYVDEAMWDTDGYDDAPGVSVPDFHSTYLYEVMKLLLKFGLDPNDEVGTDNVMYNLQDCANGYLAADTPGLLLEHGGDPNIVLKSDDTSLFHLIGFDAFFGAYEQRIRARYDAFIHYWMVLLGYNAKCAGESYNIRCFEALEPEELDSIGIFNLCELRNHRNFYFGLSLENGYRTFHIYDKRTLWEVVSINNDR